MTGNISSRREFPHTSPLPNIFLSGDTREPAPPIPEGGAGDLTSAEQLLKVLPERTRPWADLYFLNGAALTEIAQHYAEPVDAIARDLQGCLDRMTIAQAMPNRDWARAQEEFETLFPDGLRELAVSIYGRLIGWLAHAQPLMDDFHDDVVARLHAHLVELAEQQCCTSEEDEQRSYLASCYRPFFDFLQRHADAIRHLYQFAHKAR